MASNPLQSTATSWEKRISLLNQSGIKDTIWRPIAQRDLQHVEQGGTAMTDAQFIDELSAAVNHPAIQNPQRGSSWTDILGNVGSDVQDLVTGFIPGVANYVTTLPQQASDFLALAEQDPATQAKYGMETRDSGDSLANLAGKFVRDMSRTPVFGPLVPGLHTAAALTTPQGRTELAQHPVSALLDVGAATSELGRAGAFGRAAEATDAAQVADAVTADPAIAPPPKEIGSALDTFGKPRGTPLSALQSGNPYRAVARAIGDITHTRESYNQALLNSGIHPDLVNVTRANEVLGTDIALKTEKWTRDNIPPEAATLTPEEHSQLQSYAQWRNSSEADLSRLPPEVQAEARRAALETPPHIQALGDVAARISDVMRDEGVARGGLVEVTVDGRTETYAPNDPIVRKQAAYNAKVDKQLKAIAKAERAVNEATGDTQRAQRYRDLSRARDKLDKITGNARTPSEARKSDFAKLDRAKTKAVPARFQPIVMRLVRAGLSETAALKFAGDEAMLAEVFKSIETSSSWKSLKKYFTDEEIKSIRQQSIAQWRELAQSGVDPIWVKALSSDKLEAGFSTRRPLPRYYTPSQFRARALNLDSEFDVMAGLIESQHQLLIEAGSREFVNEVLKPLVQVESEYEDKVKAALDNGKPTTRVTTKARARATMRKNMVEFDPNTRGLSEFFPSVQGEKLLLPRGVAKALDSLGYKNGVLPFRGVYDKTMGVFRVSVLTTPRHLMHIGFGGLVMMTAREPGALLQLARAAKFAFKDNEADWLKFMSRDINDTGLQANDIFHLAAAKTQGRILTEIWQKAGNVLDGFNRFENNIARMYKIATALSVAKRSAVDMEEAFIEANKVMVDMNAMTPFERTVLRQAFPFWGFQRHLFRYLLTYPVDYPLRMSILNQLSEQHIRDWKTGLPQSMQFLFWLGGMDSNGNQTGIDFRSVDPFRSFYNEFTLAGLTQSLNPIAQAALNTLGLNTLAAVPELYPTSHFDPYTGTLVADRPPNALSNILSTFVPETTSIDALIGITDRYKSLQQSNPEAFKRLLLNNLGIASFVPQTINIPQEQARTEHARYTDAKNAIDTALNTGNFDDAKRYDQVPIPSLLKPYIPGRLYASPQQLEAIWNAIQQYYASQGQANINPKALLPKPRTRTSG